MGIAIVVSFGVVRLLDGASFAVERERRYWPHFAWTAFKLVQHFNIWWSLWARQDAAWSYGAFLVQLVAPFVLYLQATTLVTTSPQTVENWREHYYRVRRRFFALNIVFALATYFADIAAGVSPPPITTPIGITAISLVGLLSDSHRVHLALALFALVGNVVLVGLFAFNPAATPFG